MRFQIQPKQPLPPKTTFQLGQDMHAMKKNMISGLVTGIIDGNTFEISISEGVDGQEGSSKRIETVRIHGMDKPAASTLPGILAKLELEKMIVGRTVECEILERDDTNRAIANVPKKYFQSPFAFNPGKSD